jgi:hypothetical protein
MGVRKIILAILAAAGLCVQCVNDIHITKIQSADNIDSTDVEYCFDFKKTLPMLLLVKQNIDLDVQATMKVIECRNGHTSEDMLTQIDFVDESGKTVASFKGSWGMAHGVLCSDCDPYAGPRVIKKYRFTPHLEFPQYMYRPYNPRQREVELKDLLRFKDKTVDGYMEIIFECEPIRATGYNNFRAKITGECTADFLSNYDCSQ